MKAMILDKPRAALRLAQAELPVFKPNQVLVEVTACGVCRTDLHILDGELSNPKLPLILGHEIVGTIVETGTAVTQLSRGQRVGVPWLAYTCGQCPFCLR